MFVIWKEIVIVLGRDSSETINIQQIFRKSEFLDCKLMHQKLLHISDKSTKTHPSLRWKTKSGAISVHHQHCIFVMIIIIIIIIKDNTKSSFEWRRKVFGQSWTPHFSL